MPALLLSLALAVLLEARHYAPAEGCDTVLNAFCEAECSGPPGVKYARRAGWWQGSCGEPSVYNSDARSRDEGCIKWRCYSAIALGGASRDSYVPTGPKRRHVCESVEAKMESLLGSAAASPQARRSGRGGRTSS